MYSVTQSRFSRVEDHNRYPNTDVLYNPLRKILLSPNQIAPHRPLLNPAASHSKITRDFAYITQQQARSLRQKTLIPVDIPLVPTYNFEKVRNSQYMVVDAQQKVLGAPISAQEMQRIRLQGIKQERIVWDLGQSTNVTTSPSPTTQQEQKIKTIAPQQIQPVIIRQQYRTTYTPSGIQDYSNNYGSKTNSKNKYKYNLFSMIDQQANGLGCGCPNNEIIASKNQPQSINWLN